MRVWVAAGATTLVLVLTLGSCREPTELTLELTTDLSCAELGDTTIYVGSAEELARPLSSLTAAAVTHGCMASRDGRIGSIVVLPSGSDDARFSIRVVAGRSGSNCTADLRSGCIEARRSLGFVPHTPLYLPLALSKTCENVICVNASDTCIDGVCVNSVSHCETGSCVPPLFDAGLLDRTPLLDVIVPPDTWVETGLKDSGTTDGGVKDSGIKDTSFGETSVDSSLGDTGGGTTDGSSGG